MFIVVKVVDYPRTYPEMLVNVDAIASVMPHNEYGVIMTIGKKDYHIIQSMDDIKTALEVLRKI